MTDLTPDEQLEAFIARFTPQVASLTRAVLAKMRARLPGALELVYDNYNALVIGFSPTERASDAIFSIAAYPRWVTLFFLRGARLPDPDHLLQGGGSSVRRIVLAAPATLDMPAVRTLMEHALKRSGKPFDPTQPRRTIIKSIAAKQRPRRPV